MSSRFILISSVLLLVISSLACTSKTATNTNTNTNNKTAIAASPESSPSTQAETKPESPGAISLASPKDTYLTAYNARKNKDIATLKRVLSKDALAFLTDIGRDEKKTLDDQLKELADRPQGPKAETRNEKISGNRASIEFLDDDGKWKPMEFTKEGNDWKIDLPKAQ